MSTEKAEMLPNKCGQQDMDDQHDEIIVLQSMYGDFFEETDQGGTLILKTRIPEGLYIKRTLDSCGESNDERTFFVEHLPPVRVDFTYPSDYPSTSPPRYEITCQWLSAQQINQMHSKLHELWCENRGNVIMFIWINFFTDDLLEFLHCTKQLDLSLHNKTDTCDEHEASLEENSGTEKFQEQLASENDTNLVLKVKCPTENSDYKISESNSVELLFESLVAYDTTEREKSTENMICSICCEEKIGSEFTTLLSCGHKFCTECVENYVEIQIKTGCERFIKCLGTDCEKEMFPKQISSLISAELFEKYESRLLMSTLASISDIVYCPRKMCQSVCPTDLKDRLAQCPKCNFAFCTVCSKGYHGIAPCEVGIKNLNRVVQEYLSCNDESKKKRMEEKYGRRKLDLCINTVLSEQWVTDNSKKCPKCSMPIEKSEGCNKMFCSKCNTYFCWLCRMVLDAQNPYNHFSDKSSPCFQALFEGVGNEYEEEEWADMPDDWFNDGWENDFWWVGWEQAQLQAEAFLAGEYVIEENGGNRENL